MGGRVRVERDDQDPRIGWIVFDHPERRNAISVEMWRQIPLAVAELAADPERARRDPARGGRGGVRGRGRHLRVRRPRGASTATDYDADGARAFGALANLAKPLIAMIRGYCVGGGVAIALCADLRYAADDAVFAIPAAQLGVGYHMSGIEMLQNLVGPSRAKEIFFTARRYAAAEALAIGLVNEVVPVDALLGHVCARSRGGSPTTRRSRSRA